MNRFKIIDGNEKAFEEIWQQRDSHLKGVDGFLGFNLLRGSCDGTITLYASHTSWKSKKHFENWTRSEAFRKAHKGAGSNKNLYNGHPEFEGFESVI